MFYQAIIDSFLFHCNWMGEKRHLIEEMVNTINSQKTPDHSKSQNERKMRGCKQNEYIPYKILYDVYE